MRVTSTRVEPGRQQDHVRREPVTNDELITRLVERLGLEPGRPAPGVLFHWAAVTEDGMRAVDVYESREAADQLVGDAIGPLVGELGLPMPTITEYEVHNLLQ